MPIAREAKEAFNAGMSDLPLPTTTLPAAWSYWRPLLAVAVLGAGALALTTQAGPHDPELAVLLRFMAVVKAAMALGAAALVGWRFGSPVRPATGLAYIAGTASMAAGAGLIWRLSHIGAGALLVHGGLLALAGLAWLDRAGWDQAASAISASIRSRRSAWPGTAIRTPPRGTSRQRLRSSSIGSDTSSSPAGPSR